MRPNPKPQEMYRHFKGNIYQIRCLAKHSETGEIMVVYQAMYDTFQIYVRPLAMFMEEVDRAKYPDAKQKYRFELLQDMDDISADETQDYRQTGVSVQAETSVQAEAPAQEETSVQAEAPVQTEIPVQAEAPVQTEISIQAEVPTQTAESDEQVHIDPLVMEFLDADTYEHRLNILAALRDRVTDDMINTMAVAVDLEIKDGDIGARYEELKRCLLTFAKYECNRLR